MTLAVVIPCYRDATRALALARHLGEQRLAASYSFITIIVDDGSGDGSAAQLEAASLPGVVVSVLPLNQGRARARNHGAALVRAEFIMFLDSDCQPIDRDFLDNHLRGMTTGVVASTGSVRGTHNIFWGRYQADASARRQKAHGTHAVFAGSSQNLMVRSEAFEACGRFDSSYEGYGFEDRDLLIRLSTRGRIAWSVGAGVMHLDDISMATVIGKMQEAAGASAERFSRDHPTEYSALGYAAIDARRHPWLRPLGKFVKPRLAALAKVVEAIIQMPYVPYPAKRLIVRVASALGFLSGSSRK